MSQALGYARISTSDQDLTGQRMRLEAAGVAKIFEDVASGRDFKRPGLKQLLEYAREGDSLVVVRLDRLGRSLRELIELLEILQKRSIALRSLEEKLDTATAAGALTFHLFAAVGEFERRLIVERVRDGLAAARRRGKVPGRPHVKDKSAAARLLVGEGHTPAEAARSVGINRATLYRYLRLNPIERPPRLFDDEPEVDGAEPDEEGEQLAPEAEPAPEPESLPVTEN